MLVHFDTLWICLHDWGSICLVLRIRSTGIFGPGGSLSVNKKLLMHISREWNEKSRVEYEMSNNTGQQ